MTKKTIARTVAAVTFVIVLISFSYLLKDEDKEEKRQASPTLGLSKDKEDLLPVSVEEGEPDDESIREIKLYFATGDYEKALYLAKKAISLPKPPRTKAWLNAQLPHLLTSLGWLRLKQKRCDEAIELFEKSLKLNDLMQSHKGLVYCFNDQGFLDKAESHLHKYRKKQLNEPDEAFFQLMINVLESNRNFENALSLIANHLKTTSESTYWQHQMRLMQKKASEASQQETIRTDLFQISYHGSHHLEMGDFVLTLLESSLSELLNLFPFLPPQTNIDVILHEPKSFYEASGASHWMGGIFDGRIRIPVPQDAKADSQAIELLRKVVKHEMVHALLFQMAGNRHLPDWFEEGLAQLSTCLPQSCLGFEYPAINQQFLSPAEFSESFSKMNRVSAEIAYQQSLFLMYIMTQRIGISGLAEIVGMISPTSLLSSDSLLQASQEFKELTFKDFVAFSEKIWKQRSAVQF